MYGEQKLPSRFWDKVHVIAEASTYPGPCWVWSGGLTRNYAAVWWEGKMQYGHRVAYRVLVDPDLTADLDHLCRVTSCVNPDHLEPVTHQENTARGANGFALTGFCKKGHDVTAEAAIVVWSDGRRRCRECLWQRRRKT